VLFTKYYYDGKMKDELGGACRTHGKDAYKILVRKPAEKIT
jgi:hypothetical protein